MGRWEIGVIHIANAISFPSILSRWDLTLLSWLDDSNVLNLLNSRSQLR